MSGDLTAHIANLGLYASGTLTNAVLTFPATMGQVEQALSSIGVDGLRYQEIIITEYSASIPGLARCLGEYDSLDELNYLAHRLQGMTPEEQTRFAAALCHGEYGGNLRDLINLTYNLDCYTLFPEVKDYESYGQYLVESRREFYLPAQARFYFDYAQYGEDTAINEGGELTKQGYIYNNRSPFREIYDGQTVPTEYRVFRYPMQARAKGIRRPWRNKTEPTR